MTPSAVVSPAFAGDVTVSPAFAGDVTVSPAFAGDVTVSPAFAGDVTVSPAFAGDVKINNVALRTSARIFIICLQRGEISGYWIWMRYQDLFQVVGQSGSAWKYYFVSYG
jgi:hypothetical protein